MVRSIIRRLGRLPVVLKALVSLGVLVLMVLASPLIFPVVVFVAITSAIALIIRVLQHGSLRGWGIVAGISVALALTFGGISEIFYGDETASRRRGAAQDVPTEEKATECIPTMSKSENVETEQGLVAEGEAMNSGPALTSEVIGGLETVRSLVKGVPETRQLEHGELRFGEEASAFTESRPGKEVAVGGTSAASGSDGVLAPSRTVPLRPVIGTHDVAFSSASSASSTNVPRGARASNVTPSPTAVSDPYPAPGTDGGLISVGAYISGAPWDPTKLDEFTGMVGTPPKILMWYQDWAHDGIKEFDPVKMNAVVSRGAMPMVTWEPWDHTGGASQPAYALRTIISGDHDTYIRQWARDAAAWGQPMYLRFAHEMNCNWHSWSAGVNGNTSAEYVAAWRHVHDLFLQEGATNVRWVWSPNVAYDDGGTPFIEVYPGDAYVDWVGLDGYNWGASQSWSRWMEFAAVFGSSYDELATVTDKPMMIAETASTEAGGDKAAWIKRGLLDDLPSRFPRVRAVVWFHENKETDWRVTSSPPSLAAYSEVAASPSYQGRLP